MMSPKERIRDLALRVNQGLIAYIAVHDAIFEEAATVKSFLKNLSGRAVPMSQLLADSESLVPLWDDISSRMGAFKSSDYSSLSPDERHFFDILSRYVSALRKTVTALVDRQRLMNEAAQGGRESPMTWKAYREKEASYQAAVKDYMAIGEELNSLRSLIFDEQNESTVSLETQCAAALLIVTRTVLDDSHWRAFGFKKCPHRGRIFQGFVSAAKLERETTILRELWAASLGSICRWAVTQDYFPYRLVFIAKLMEYAIDGVREPLWPVFRFVTRQDAIEFLQRACAAYMQTGDSDRSKVFLNRCVKHMGQQIPKEWIVGAAWLFAHPNSYVLNCRLALITAGIASNPNSDIEIIDDSFLVLAEELIAYVE